jgi:hypothetical protein
LLFGIEDGEVAGIFLKEKGGLVLHSLIGSLEAVIAFIDGSDSNALLNKPGLYEKEEESEYLWMSVPLGAGRIRGAVVVASKSSDGERCLSFLKRTLPHIIHIIATNNIKSPAEQVPSEDLLLQDAEFSMSRN